MLDPHSTFPALLAGSAFIAATALGACEEAPVTPEAPPEPAFHHKDGHGGGPGGGGDDDGGSTADSAALDLGADSNGDGLGDAMSTPEPQVLEVVEDEDILRLQTGDQPGEEFTFSGAHNFDDTRAAAEDEFSDGEFSGTDECLVKKKGNKTIDAAKIESAIAKLTDGGQVRDNFNLRVDKNALGGSSEDHKIFASWAELDGSAWDLNVRPAEVALLSGDIDLDATVQYTGGSVGVKMRSSNPSFTVVCPVATEDVNGNGGVGDAVEAFIDRLP